MKIAILHLDLGIGGAEKLIISIAISLINSGHDITIYTSHHDKLHCFEETINNGMHVFIYISLFYVGKFRCIR